MGQYWMLFNLTRGTYTVCGGYKMLEFGQYRGFHMRLASALRPGGLWHGHRVVLSGDYDDNQKHVAAYLRAHGLAIDAEAEVPFENLFALASSNGPMGHTSDSVLLGWIKPREPGEGISFGCGFHTIIDPTTRANAPLMRDFEYSMARERLFAVSHDARQRLRVADEPAWLAFVCLLAESSGQGYGDMEAPFRAQWAAHSVAVLSGAEAEALGYEDVTALLLTPQWLGEYKHHTGQDDVA